MQCQVYEPEGLPWKNFAAISCVHIRDEDDPQNRTRDPPGSNCPLVHIRLRVSDTAQLRET